MTRSIGTIATKPPAGKAGRAAVAPRKPEKASAGILASRPPASASTAGSRGGSADVPVADGAPEKSGLMEPLKPAGNLASEVAKRIAGEISGGTLKPGEKLPTEQELMHALGVSRTVIREAVAALKADGLVTTRQGSGAFVASDARRVPFRIVDDGLTSLDDVVGIMELRAAVEVEAAALAADRATQDDVKAIDAALHAVDAAMARGEGAVAEDFAFHRAVAAATGNRHFDGFLGFLGHHVIPRQNIRVTHATPDESREYLRKIQADHVRIADAIRAGDPGEARRAMRAHLARALQRYRGLAARQPKP